MEPEAVERPFRCRTEPHVVIHSGRNRLIRRISETFPDLAHPGFHQADFAQLSGGDVLDRIPVVPGTAALRSDLNDTFVTPRRIPHSMSLFDCFTERLFDVDVFVRLACGNSLESVPMIRSRNQYGIDIRIFENFAEVFFFSWSFTLFFFDFSPDFVKDGIVDVAKRLDHGSISNRTESNVTASIAASNQSQGDSFVSSQHTGAYDG